MYQWVYVKDTCSRNTVFSPKKTHLPLHPQHTQRDSCTACNFLAKSHLTLHLIITLLRSRLLRRHPPLLPVMPNVQVLMMWLDSKKIYRSHLSQPEKSGDSFTPFRRGSCGLLQFSWIGPRPLQLGAAQCSITLASAQLMNTYLAETLELPLSYMTSCPCSVLTVTPLCISPRQDKQGCLANKKMNK